MIHRNQIKKLISALVVLMVITSTTLSNFYIIKGDITYDDDMPILNRYTIENAEKLTGDSKFKMNVDLTEEGLGVTRATFKFRGEKTKREVSFTYVAGEVDCLGHKCNPLFTGVHSLIFDLKKAKLPQDTYVIEDIFLYDANNNSYLDSLGLRHEWEDKSTLEFKIVTSKITDVTSPIIKSFKIPNNNNITLDAFCNVEIDCEDETGVKEIVLTYQMGEDKVIFYCYDQTGRINGKRKVNFIPGYYKMGNAKKGTYYLSEIRCTDRYGNSATMHISPFNNSQFTNSITVTKVDAEEMIEPQLESAQILKKNITTPNVLKLRIKVKTDNPSISNVRCSIENQEGRVYFLDAKLQKDLTSGIYKISFPISPYTQSGEYHIKTISFYSAYGITDYWKDSDVSTVKEEYSLDSRLKDDKFVVKSPYNVSYYGSLSNSTKIMQVVKNLKEGQIAVLDYSYQTKVDKKIFETIAGKNITLVFQNSDVQWIFNGKNVKKSRCKTIDLKTKISRESGKKYGFANDKYVLKVKFASNGVLPGTAKIRVNTNYLSAKYKVNDDMILSYMKKLPNVLDKNVQIKEDGFAEISISHNSTYILSDKMPRLASPKSFAVKKKTSSSVTLKWNKVFCAEGYEIYRSDSVKGNMKKIKTIKSFKTLKFTDKNLRSGKKYYYRLKAISKTKGVKSIYSKKITAKTK
ncbi:MAG: fibronectin type III domain-containing protein [Eubacterium sp.]|nr:fibronectin type III domain-containing protein [Eubacterium sp.]